jgi:TetR/AcrR family transcriptional regulator, transcriptional repressor for nem operon
MARTKEFDPDEAVNAATAVFRANGYDATTTDDLRFAMGIGRQSLYDTFGGKKQLFLAALRRYNAERTNGFERLVDAAPTALDGIAEILVATAREDPQERRLRCLGVDAACTFSSNDADVAAILKESTATLDRVLKRSLERAKTDGALRTSVRVGDAVLLVRCALSGLRVAARGGAPPAELRRIALTLVNGLRP